MAVFARLSPDALLREPAMLQGWQPSAAGTLAAGFAGAGALGLLRVPAFPQAGELSARIAEARGGGGGLVGLDLRGVLGNWRELLDMALREKVSFLAHPARTSEQVQDCGLPRLAFVKDAGEAGLAAQGGARGLVLEPTTDPLGRLREILRRVKLPLIASVGADGREGHALLENGAAGLQIHSPGLLREGTAAGVLQSFRTKLRDAMGSLAFTVLVERAAPPLPSLKIRNIEVTYPIIQGGMGIGISWEHLAGAVARNGCVGIVSAIGTGYHRPAAVKLCQGRPEGPENLNSSAGLRKILEGAQAIAGSQGVVGVNILCAINGYERVVHEAVDGGARLIISGAGLPLALPGYVGDADVALVPIVSSARALKLICKHWNQRFHRLPDAVVLEGPESGGHQGFSFEQCVDPAFAVDNLLEPVLEERDRWGTFPVIVAGGVWDRSDLDRLIAKGASGVQMATRFIGTYECDAATAFKEVILQSTRDQIRLMKSPVGMPARGVLTALQRDLAAGTAPPIRCVGDCLSPCNRGEGAREAGYCIADRLGDAQAGNLENGLFFTGSNGWRLQDFLPVRELIGEITQDFGLARLAARRGA